ncbi:isoprenylcysteine carboxylmethyltransferase family protein [Labrenzia sp. PHM005]|nr:isoprenylcysteine carboxylmethyltransferase family protein [Labrenzia sp. PHM005]
MPGTRRPNPRPTASRLFWVKDVSLELKVPPVVVFLIALALLYAGHVALPFASISPAFQGTVAFVVALIGCAFGGQAVVAFIKAKTTVHPMKPEEASTLVTTGFFKVSRNPMYFGLLCLLLAAGIHWGTLTLVIIGPLFIWYMTEFQIKPEEERLKEVFGEDYLAYLEKVRRWI